MKSKKFSILTIAIALITISSSYVAFSRSTPDITTAGNSYSEKRHNISKNYYPVNENGETYGPDIYNNPVGVEPDLIAAVGIDGTLGYVRSDDFDLNPSPSTPEEALALQKIKPSSRLIPLYKEDGKTVIGSFKLGN